MGEAAVKQEDFEAIGEYVKTRIPQWLKEADIIPKDYSTNTFLVERVVRVEDLRNDMNKKFTMMFFYLTTIFAVIGTLVTVFGLKA